NYMDDNSTDCWAADAATRNGKYYFYFSDRKRGIGVMVSKSPTGPFKDALGEPLVSPMHDPTAFINDDNEKTPYLVYGDKSGGGFHIARLNNDMISLAEKPKPIQINGKEWKKAPEWMDKNYLFKANDTYYLSWGRDYAVSKNIYGPYESVGAVGTGHNLNEFAHGSFFNWKGQFYHIWSYYLRDRYKYRESVITYCHLDNEGNIVTDTKFLDKHFNYGVGRYKAKWPNIEAEWYYEISSGIKKEGDADKGFFLTEIKDESWVRFSNVDFEENIKKFTAKIKVTNSSGKLEIRVGEIKGTRAGTIELDSDISGFKIFSASVDNLSGVQDLFLKFVGDDDFQCQLDWISFNEK
ncbi:MAG TPA: family 43 glycosylhydrolase, partial [Prolixibacteraceae bacterium]|nr:family 43 glycosylhydrolase [Prolixibacteraceae bacterium]